MSSTLRAYLATALFILAGVIALYMRDVPNTFVLPHVIFYLVLTINTFFSVRFFSVITPPSLVQTAIDGALVLAYLMLAFSIGLPTWFAFFVLSIFALAPIKYAHMLGYTAHDRTLRKKILIDLLGTLMSIYILGLTLAGLYIEAAWTLTAVFTGANVYVLAINPMYRFIESSEGAGK